MPGARRRRGKAAVGDDEGEGESGGESVAVTPQTKAMVRQALLVDRHLLVHKGKAFDKFMAKFDKIEDFQKMRDFLEAKQLPNGYCVRERLSQMGHAQVQVALYNGTGWKDLSLGAVLAMSTFKRKLRQRRKAGQQRSSKEKHDENSAGPEDEEAQTVQTAPAHPQEQEQEVCGVAAQTKLASDSVEQHRLDSDAAEMAKHDKIHEEAVADHVAAIKAQQQAKIQRIERNAELLRRVSEQEDARQQKAAVLQNTRDNAMVNVTIVDSGRMDWHSTTPEYQDCSGPDDASIAREYGTRRRVEAAAAAEKRRARAVQLAEQRRAQAAVDTQAIAMKIQQAAEALAADAAAVRLKNEKKLWAASQIAAQKTAAQKIGRARVAWQQEQAWKTARDSAAITLDHEAAQRQRLRHQVQSVPTNVSGRRALGRRPASAPVGGRPNPPRSKVPVDKGGASKLNHTVVRYGSCDVGGHHRNSTGFSPSTPRPPPAGPVSHGRAAAICASVASGGPSARRWSTPLGKRLAQNRAIRERANEQQQRPRPRPASAGMAAVLA